MDCGLLNLNKPSGITSRRVVDLVERLVRPAKAGHAGTLDPLATGVLIVCVGPATRLIDLVQRLPKTYLGSFLLGRESDTEDIQGDVRELSNAPQPNLDELKTAAAALTGPIMQRPPAYSALKVQGRRAYDLARAGQQVDLAPRPVTIHTLEVTRYDYPALELSIQCSSGTYVRSLGRDLAERVGTAAVMSALTRTAIGGFRVEEAIDPESLTLESLRQHLQPMSRAAEALPKAVLNAAEATRIGRGQFIERPDLRADELAAFDDSGCLLAILHRRPDGRFGAARNFQPS